jgi:FtsP/CotA-like multicopper oxidase with cupredoxin domain
MTLTRREFLRLGTLTVGGLWAASRRFPLTAWAAPEVPFRDPPLLDLRRPEPGLLEGTLVAREQWVDLGFRRARLLTYNGSMPGPLLRAQAGDTIRLKLVNNLKEITNLHYHGLHIPPTGRADNVFIHVPPGEAFDYEFTLPREFYGTALYHPHTFHPPTAVYAFAGMLGPIVVEGDLDRAPELQAAEEHIVTLKDIAFQGDRPAPHTIDDWGEGKEGDYVLVNGLLQPTLRLRRRLLRLRFINMSNARHYRLRFEPGIPFYLIGTDGGFIEKPVELEEILLVPAQRADVLVRPDRPGRYRLVHLPYPRGTYSSRPANSLLMTIDVPEGLPDPPPVPSRLESVRRLEVDPQTPTRTIEFGLFLINGRFMDHSHQRADVETRLGRREVWELWNNHPVDHPFHMHTYHFQVLTRNGVPEPFPAWHDTIPFRPNERVRIAVAFEDFGGKTLFHCHILEHVAMGMMAILQVQEGG